MEYVHPEFRTSVEVGELTVTGVLPGTAWRPAGGIAISGPVGVLRPGRARELADALCVVAGRMDAAADERYGVGRLWPVGRAD